MTNRIGTAATCRNLWTSWGGARASSPNGSPPMGSANVVMNAGISGVHSKELCAAP